MSTTDKNFALSTMRLAMFRLLGGALIIVGAILGVGGMELIYVGGSWYYTLVGAVWVAAGIMIIRRRVEGLYLYIVTFLITLIWSIWESALDGWALLPRLDLAFAFLVWAVVLMPSRFSNGTRTWRAYAAAMVVVTAVALPICVIAANPSVVPLTPTAIPPGTAYFDAATVPAAADWPTYGGGTGAQRYSDLAQITPKNVGQLRRAWVYHTGDIPKEFGNELTPIKIGDSIYGCSNRHKIFSLDPATGKQKWMYDPHTPPQFAPSNSACRGVAYYKRPGATAVESCAEEIIVGTLDAKIIAVDARTGEVCGNFGTDGVVDLNDGLGQVVPGMVSVTSALTIVRGVIVAGYQVTDGQLRWAPSGVIRGFDAVTGKLRFAWDMVQPQITTLPPPGKTYSLGTPNMWSTAVGDEALGLVYLPMAISAGDYMSSTRLPGEREYSSSVTALDVETGKPRWVYQFIKNDVWDYDTPSQPSLVSFPTPAGSVPALVQTTKQGDIYVLDRRTGEPLHKVSEIKVAQDGVEPAERSPTQKHSGFNSIQQPDLTEKMMWGISPIDQMVCRIQFRSAHYEGVFTPPTVDEPWIQYPSNNGGSDWGSLSVDVRRGVIVLNYNDLPSYSRLVPRAVDDKLGVFWLGDPRYKGPGPGANRPQAGLPYGQDVNTGWVLGSTGVICKQPPFGRIRAIDLATGKTLWDHPLGTAQRNGPWGIPSMLPFVIGLPNNGGSITTAGGLVFVAATTDDFLRAIDIETHPSPRTGKLHTRQVDDITGQVGSRITLRVVGLRKRQMRDVLACREGGDPRTEDVERRAGRGYGRDRRVDRIPGADDLPRGVRRCG